MAGMYGSIWYATGMDVFIMVWSTKENREQSSLTFST